MDQNSQNCEPVPLHCAIPYSECQVNRIAGDLWECVPKKSACEFAVFFGYEKICQHPDVEIINFISLRAP